jgi:hypothetical protein
MSILILSMLQFLELGIIVAIFVLGCRTKRAAMYFLPLVVLELLLFDNLVGNPIGLLTSIGGWLILDSGLALTALIVNLPALLTIVGPDPPDG